MRKINLFVWAILATAILVGCTDNQPLSDENVTVVSSQISSELPSLPVYTQDVDVGSNNIVNKNDLTSSAISEAEESNIADMPTTTAMATFTVTGEDGKPIAGITCDISFDVPQGNYSFITFDYRVVTDKNGKATISFIQQEVDNGFNYVVLSWDRPFNMDVAAPDGQNYTAEAYYLENGGAHSRNEQYLAAVISERRFIPKLDSILDFSITVSAYPLKSYTP